MRKIHSVKEEKSDFVPGEFDEGLTKWEIYNGNSATVHLCGMELKKLEQEMSSSKRTLERLG
ncbi:hypothetical protein [Gracilimonas sp.]|uniref:hypothetical protein n=1 Tax=Gracilimonas sp. TaxID=1974203 RepID=UPI003D12A0EC